MCRQREHTQGDNRMAYYFSVQGMKSALSTFCAGALSLKEKGVAMRLQRGWAEMERNCWIEGGSPKFLWSFFVLYSLLILQMELATVRRISAEVRNVSPEWVLC